MDATAREVSHITNACLSCNRNDDNGICHQRMAQDGYVMRCVGPWSQEKHYYLNKYANMFTASMRCKWSCLNYVDLFCGPGICYDQATGLEEEGSPLIALTARHSFTNCFFGDLNGACIDALRTRCKAKESPSLPHFLDKECNKAALEVGSLLSADSLTLAFIDPTGVHISLDALAGLTRRSRVDLILNLPFWMDINRNRKSLLESSQNSGLDLLLPGWRESCSKPIRTGDTQGFLAALMDCLGRHLGSLGYIPPSGQDFILIRTAGQTGPKLYYLVYASKHPRGYDFWRKVGSIGADHQRKLF